MVWIPKSPKRNLRMGSGDEFRFSSVDDDLFGDDDGPSLGVCRRSRLGAPDSRDARQPDLT